MTIAIVVIVVSGVVASMVLGAAVGLDAVGVVILASIVGLGSLALAVAVRSRTGAVTPGRCMECGGLISPNAPYCKHCGAVR